MIKSKLRVISDLELRIIDLSQSGKLVARVSFYGKAIKEKLLFPIIAKELRAKNIEIESSKSNDKKEVIDRDEAINRINGNRPQHLLSSSLIPLLQIL